MEIKAISLHQPWAWAIAFGLKHIETRNWKTQYRGKLLVCSTAKRTKRLQFLHDYLVDSYKEKIINAPKFEDLEFGKALAIATLTDCIPTETLINQISRLEQELGDYSAGRWGFILQNIQQIEPFPVSGQQRIYNLRISHRLLTNSTFSLKVS